MVHQHIHVEESDIGKWDDESPLNYDNCDLAECEKYFKRKIPIDNDRNVMAGQVYRHFKGQTVKVLHISQDAEAPWQFHVVYECEDGSVWSRPYGMFVSEVDHEKYPNAKQKYRFGLVEDAAEKEEFGRWVPCSERLPELDTPVLAQWRRYYSDENNIDILYLNGLGEWCADLGMPNGKIIAWMPLPEPYKEKE